MQGLLLAVVTLQTGAALAGSQVIVSGEKHPRLIGKAVEGADQGSGRDRVMALMRAGLLIARLGVGLDGWRRKARHAERQGQHRQVQSAGAASRGEARHEVPDNLTALRVNRAKTRKGHRHDEKNQLHAFAATLTHQSNGFSTRIGNAASSRRKAWSVSLSGNEPMTGNSATAGSQPRCPGR
ncbi:hypothetical protein D3C84_657900 [compost metagenome]